MNQRSFLDISGRPMPVSMRLDWKLCQESRRQAAEHPHNQTAEPGNIAILSTFQPFKIAPCNGSRYLIAPADQVKLHFLRSMSLDLAFATTGAVINRHQLAQLNVKLFCLVHLPFVMPAATQRIALVLFFEGRLMKGYDFRHDEPAAPREAYGAVQCSMRPCACVSRWDAWPPKIHALHARYSSLPPGFATTRHPALPGSRRLQRSSQ